MEKIKIINENNVIEKFTILIKFGEKENLLKLQEGNLYMKNLKYYNDLEEKQALIGMGDKDDGKAVLTYVDFKMIDIDTGKIILAGKYDKAVLDYKICNNPVFCLFALDNRNIVKYGSLNEDNIDYRMEFTEIQKKEFKKNFGDSALLINNPYEFINRINKSFKEQELSFLNGKVDYYDQSINDKEMIDSIKQDYNKVAFWKRKSDFDYQQEYRILCTSIEVDDYIQINIGDIKDITQIIPMEEIFKSHFILSHSEYILNED